MSQSSTHGGQRHHQPGRPATNPAGRALSPIPAHQRRIVALGGGHGLSATLSALRLLTDNVTAIATVADDGGSSGRLRRDFDVLPPGDLRMALAALCDDSEWGHTWRDVLQHRFAGEGDLRGHALGNLMIVSLWELLGDTVDGLDLVGRLLGVHGRVLPMAAEPLEIVAEVAGHDPAHPDEVVEVRGQHLVASSPGRVLSIGIVPTCPRPCTEALEAVADADWVVLGPGSWFTSVMPHLLVPDLADALGDTGAQRLLALNLEIDRDETRDFRAEDHLASLAANAPELRIDVVLADPSVVLDAASLRSAAEDLGAELVVTPVAVPGNPAVHDPLRLAAAFRDVIG
ncbi:MAG: uridine diphosphate-N-acetylglucosamine-binding protein YvcK [Intrasporangium sp.]|uniref:gluconeogenesis factor YvcK family protein n=1 Tax=Intrasporangium sp. TaxID=1925024 RepID=UPI00264A270E|nr:uridine diphosphate-N-acetylglucosamine-binding protein YvcK [Intrasporangium sp.]MDN5795981.1 uridine diphosphate-N-acetylglucosamine-binding protein YvcK [Intrasporangium sp.]